MANHDKANRLPTSWHWVEEIIKDGKTPTNRAIAAALRGKAPPPLIVREFLADCIENGWPKGGRTRTGWERSSEALSKKQVDASLEVDQRWNCYQVCGHVAHGATIAEAIDKVVARTGRGPERWPKLDRPDLAALFQRFAGSDSETYADLGSRSLDDVIQEVADEVNIAFETLRVFHTSHRYRRR